MIYCSESPNPFLGRPNPYMKGTGEGPDSVGHLERQFTFGPAILVITGSRVVKVLPCIYTPRRDLHLKDSITVQATVGRNWHPNRPEQADRDAHTWLDRFCHTATVQSATSHAYTVVLPSRNVDSDTILHSSLETKLHHRHVARNRLSAHSRCGI